jgi:Golgi nucleoside diphosphatase
MFTKNSKKFDILNIDTWGYASDSKEMIWNGSKLLNKDNKTFTEKDIIELARSIIKFLERNGEMITQDKKIVTVKNLLNRMENPEYYEQLHKQEQLEKDKAIPDGLFNPRDPETYKFAKHNKPLIIDGVHIFNIHYENDREVKETETEKGFVDVLSMMLKMHCKNPSEITAQEYIEKYIKQKVAECSPKKITNYGGL